MDFMVKSGKAARWAVFIFVMIVLALAIVGLVHVVQHPPQQWLDAWEIIKGLMP